MMPPRSSTWPVHSSAIKAAKKQYADVRLEGNVEGEFLYHTLLSSDLLPFGHLPFRDVVLPLVSKPNGYEILTAAEARKQGYLGLADWLEKVEAIWREKRGEKAGRISIYEWLDYRKKLTPQCRKRFTVLYPAFATYIVAEVLEYLPHRTKTGSLGILRGLIREKTAKELREIDMLLRSIISRVGEAQPTCMKSSTPSG